jgi:hypothetical protein
LVHLISVSQALSSAEGAQTMDLMVKPTLLQTRSTASEIVAASDRHDVAGGLSLLFDMNSRLHCMV